MLTKRIQFITSCALISSHFAVRGNLFMKRSFGASLWLFAFCGSADIVDEGSGAAKPL
jgi:hypothetical protein